MGSFGQLGTNKVHNIHKHLCRREGDAKQQFISLSKKHITMLTVCRPVMLIWNINSNSSNNWRVRSARYKYVFNEFLAFHLLIHTYRMVFRENNMIASIVTSDFPMKNNERYNWLGSSGQLETNKVQLYHQVISTFKSCSQ